VTSCAYCFRFFICCYKKTFFLYPETLPTARFPDIDKDKHVQFSRLTGDNIKGLSVYCRSRLRQSLLEIQYVSPSGECEENINRCIWQGSAFHCNQCLVIDICGLQRKWTCFDGRWKLQLVSVPLHIVVPPFGTVYSLKLCSVIQRSSLNSSKGNVKFVCLVIMPPKIGVNSYYSFRTFHPSPVSCIHSTVSYVTLWRHTQFYWLVRKHTSLPSARWS